MGREARECRVWDYGTENMLEGTEKMPAQAERERGRQRVSKVGGAKR